MGIDEKEQETKEKLTWKGFVSASLLGLVIAGVLTVVMATPVIGSTGNGTSQIGYSSWQVSDSNGNTLYDQFWTYLTSGSTPYLIYVGQEHATAASGNVWELAGGDGANGAINPTWTTQSSVADPMYIGPNGNAHYGSWYEFQPDNTISNGSTGTSIVSTGISATVGITVDGVTAGVTGSYDVTYNFPVPEFMMEPTAMTSLDAAWLFSDNQGQFGSTPLAATSMESASVQAFLNQNNIVTFNTQAQFVKINLVWNWGCLCYDPVYSVVTSNNGFNSGYIS